MEGVVRPRVELEVLAVGEMAGSASEEALLEALIRVVVVVVVVKGE